MHAYHMHFACVLYFDYIDLYKVFYQIEIMPSLQIRNLPLDLYKALKQLAKTERRSISQQAIISLSKGLQIDVDDRERRKRVLEEIEKQAYLFKDLPKHDVAAWIREDRDR